MSADSSNPHNIPQSVRDRLAPDYLAWVDASPPLRPVPLHTTKWGPAFRTVPEVPPDLGRMPPVPVGSERTIQFGTFSVSIMIPEGERPAGGWPAFLFMHGGGWVFGNAASGNSLFSRACVEAKCVVISVDYRLAPEHPFPAAVDDCWEALLWLFGEGKHELGIDVSRVAVGGVSAGGNLAAVLAQRARLANPPLPLVLQLLIIPATNCSLSAQDKSQWTPSMIEHEYIFTLCTHDVLWFRDLYLPNEEDRRNPDASPLLQDDKRAYEGLAPAVVSVAEFDALKSEGEAYAEKMKAHGVDVRYKEYKGITHTGSLMDRVCQVARSINVDQIEALKAAFSK